MKTKKSNIFNSEWLSFILAILLLSIVFKTSAGEKQPPPGLEIKYSTNGDVNNTVYSNTPVINEKSPQLISLERQLDAARISGNKIASRQIQAEINSFLGQNEVYQPMTENNNKHTSFNDKPSGEEHEFDYFLSPIHTYSIYSHAFGIAPTGSTVAGRTYYLITQDSQSGSDTLKLIHSTNNGVTWSQTLWMSLTGYSFNGDEMDLEVVYDGTDTWIFAVFGVVDQSDGRKKIYFFRRNVTNSSTYWTILNFPGSGAGMNYYNPRITSDNTNFTSNTYVMVLCSMDSTAGANHFAKQKYMYSSTPFDATPGFNYTQPNGASGFHWSTSLGTTANTYLYGDIAYYKDDGGSSDNRIMTVYNCYRSGFNNIYIAYLNNYNTPGSSMSVTETSVNKHLKIAFNGGSNNRNGMITYVRQFNATDWDIFALRTTNGGSNAGGWVRDTVDYTGDFARSCDLSAVRNSNSQFRLTYAQDNSGNGNQPAAYFKSFTGSSWSNSLIFSNAKIDTVYAKPRAGYLLGGGDDGTGIWSTYNGYNGYFAKQILTTTGILTNNEIPSGFSLSQNYPNPFNPVTNIKFSIPVSGIVTLKIYDITGKEVAELVNQNMNPGLYTFDFDASNLSSGAYFYKLSANGFTDVKKMMLVK
jgi:hypothetical protein